MIVHIVKEREHLVAVLFGRTDPAFLASITPDVVNVIDVEDGRYIAHQIHESALGNSQPSIPAQDPVILYKFIQLFFKKQTEVINLTKITLK